MKKSFQMSVSLHYQQAKEDTVNIDTTVQEKNIIYPIDSKLAIKIVNRLTKLTKSHLRERSQTSAPIHSPLSAHKKTRQDLKTLKRLRSIVLADT